MAKLLYILMPLLMLDALIEISLLGATVGWLHARAGKSFTVNYPAGSSFELHGKPAVIELNQGHTSNGAAGTAFFLVGVLGFLTLWYEGRRQRRLSTTSYSGLYIVWLVFCTLSTLLTLSALIYTYIVVHNSKNQHISLSVALDNPEPKPYPLLTWTPDNWFVAVLALPLAKASDRGTIDWHLSIMKAWYWNLIPLFILGVIITGLAVREFFNARRRGGGMTGGAVGEMSGKAPYA